MRSRILRRLALVGMVALGGCFLRGPGTLDDHMYRHFAEVGQVQTGVILGDLDAVREPARWLAEHTDHSDLPGTDTEALETLRAAALSASTSTSLAGAAQSTATMGAACGSCHLSNSAGPVFRIHPTDAPGQALGEHMVRHLWGADLLWEGLIAPSDEAWLQGAEFLSEAPFFDAADESPAGTVLELAGQVHELGREARTATGQEARAQVYQRILVSCAGCHGVLGVTPGF